MKKILFALIALCAFTACDDDDYTDWAAPQANAPQEAMNVSLSLSPVEQIFYGEIAGDSVQVFTPEIVSDNGYTNATYAVTLRAKDAAASAASFALNADMQGRVAKEELQNAVVAIFGRTNGLHEMTASAEASIVVKGTAFTKTAATEVAVYIEFEAESWYLIGGCIGDGAWNNSEAGLGTSIYPMFISADDPINKLTFTGYFTPDGFKLIKTIGSWDEQWGSSDGALAPVKNDGGSGNFTVPVAGYYTVTLDTKADALAITPADITPAVYPSMFISGSFNDWGETAMSPVNTAACMEGHNHVWAYTLDAAGAVEAKFLQPGWSPNWGSDTFPNGFGVANGANIPVEAGSYVVIFNDIDGAYRFIQK